MAHWLRYEHHGRIGFGTLNGSSIAVHSGDLLQRPQATGSTVALGEVRVLAPLVPGQMVALVDNYRALVAKLAHALPTEPL